MPSAQAELAWAEFETDHQLSLKKDLVINDRFQFKAGTQFIVHAAETLDPVPVMVFILYATQCDQTTPQTPVEMVILDETVGFEWKKNCRADFYVEFKDLYLKSYFENVIK